MNRNDSLINITLDELITTIQSNEPEISPAVVKKVYMEILEKVLEDAEYMIENNMDDIIKECN